MKRRMALLLSSVLVVSALSGCAGKKDETAKGSDEKVKIEFFHYKPEAIQTFDKLIAKFEQANPNIDVVQSSPPEAPTVLRTRVAKRDVPDIVSVGGDVTYADFAKAGFFEDLTNAPELQNIQPSYVEMLKDISALDKVYAVPYAANANAVIYNKKLFAELGLTVPKTWDEFIATAQKIKDAGKTPFYFTFKDAWTALPSYNVLAANTQGDNFFADRREGKTTFKAGYKEATDKFLKLIEYGHKDNFGKTYNDGNVAFAKGESVMYLQGIWAIPEIKKANPDIEVGVFPYPATNDPANNKVVSGVDFLLALSKTSKHPEEAKKFVDFLLESENAQVYVEEQNTFSAIKGIEQKDPILEGLKENFEKGEVVDFPDHYVPTSMFLDRQLQQLVQDKNADAFLTNIDRAWDDAEARK